MSCRAVFKYEGSQVMVAAKGESFDDFKAQFGEDERAFAYIRLQVMFKALFLIKFGFLLYSFTRNIVYFLELLNVIHIF